MATINDYLLDLSNLLRDSKYQFTSQANMISYINKARNEVAKRSACLQAVITGQAPFGTSSQPNNMIVGGLILGTLPNAYPNNANPAGAVATDTNDFSTIPGVEVYPVSFANSFLQNQYSGYKSVQYVQNISASWGAYTPTLDYMPWDDLQAYCRANNLGITSYPRIWSQKGVGENANIYLFPVPSSSTPGTMVWECSCSPIPLYTSDDPEAIPEMYQDCVKYYAAYLAYLSHNRTGQAEIMIRLFDEQLQINGVASDWGHSATHYWGY